MISASIFDAETYFPPSGSADEVFSQTDLHFEIRDHHGAAERSRQRGGGEGGEAGTREIQEERQVTVMTFML